MYKITWTSNTVIQLKHLIYLTIEMIEEIMTGLCNDNKAACTHIL